MRKFWLQLAGVIAVVIISALVWQWAMAPSPPQFDGKPVPYWVQKEITSSEPTHHPPIDAIGADAVPYLVNWLHYEDSWLQTSVGWIGKKLAFLPGLKEEMFVRPSAEECREKTISLLGRLGPEASSAAPELLGMLDVSNQEQTRDVLYALVRIRPAPNEALPKLRRFLETSPSMPNRLLAVRAICSIEPNEDLAIEYFDRALNSAPRDVWHAARIFRAPYLDDFSPEAKEKIARGMTNLLHSSQESTIDAAVRVLADLGEASTNALPQLLSTADGAYSNPSIPSLLSEIASHSDQWNREIASELASIVSRTNNTPELRENAIKQIVPPPDRSMYGQYGDSSEMNDQPDTTAFAEFPNVIIPALLQAVKADTAPIKTSSGIAWDKAPTQWKLRQRQEAQEDLKRLRAQAAFTLCALDFDTAKSEEPKAVVKGLTAILQDKRIHPQRKIQAIDYIAGFDSPGDRAIAVLERVAENERNMYGGTSLGGAVVKAAKDALQRLKTK